LKDSLDRKTDFGSNTPTEYNVHRRERGTCTD
jgi:hypothetical protein